MDDPWGSPWASTENEKDAKPPSPTKSTRSDLEPPPRAFFSGSGSPRIPTISGPSPWADDDDGFGDWAAAETPGQTQSGWGGWGAPSPKLTSPPRDDVFGEASPIAWPGNTALSKPANVSLRQPSPDPWAADFSSLDDSVPRFVIDAPSTDTVPIPDETKQENEPGWAEEEPAEAGPQEDSRDREEEEEGDGTPTQPNATAESAVAEGPGRTSIADAERASVESTGQSHESPFSSPSGDDDTDLDDDRQDSPITSIDEDARRQPVLRKTSGKVQELVSKFDGLARALSQEPPAVRRERSTGRSNTSADSDEAADFGDFEDADEEPQTPERPSTPRPADHPLPESGASTAISSPQSAQKTPGSVRRILAAHGPVSFDVDLGDVDKLFSLPGGAEETETDAYVPDHIIDDSFTEISERKTWYRVSRMGSSRKHNAGDDENYRLVTWPTSTIREETIKVVRRWMEEDSIAGRVTLGGGISKTQKNMFGWDSSAEPVALDAVFRKKSHARAASLQTSTSAAQKVSSSLRSPLDRPSSIASTPVPTFGWSSSPTTDTHAPKVQPPAVQLPLSMASPSLPTNNTPSPGIPPPIALTRPGQGSITTKTFAKPESQPSHQTASLVASTSSAPPNNTSLDDDDEWGEMVASPSVPDTGVNGFGLLDTSFAATNNTSLPFNPGPTTEPRPAVAPAVAPAATAMPPPTDPWASVDFSVFETAKAPPPAVPGPGLDFPKATISTTPIIPTTPLDVPSGLQPAAPASKDSNNPFTPTTPLEIHSPVALRGAAEYFGADVQPPEDDAARHILASLPDLSYMLR
ncbi:hypothetical protein QBC47DRAFT_175847 [Echria macrotheca]|uniref:Glucan 1, 4-alpha-glucosidase n=1 Tax=Echria macrotheca TaxID=438768 RepID=A0AAJ0BF68_9PEZI|nr:hypothetical protein QBC47DRAFT_175847 [Echria macrotheca]